MGAPSLRAPDREHAACIAARVRPVDLPRAPHQLHSQQPGLTGQLLSLLQLLALLELACMLRLPPLLPLLLPLLLLLLSWTACFRPLLTWLRWLLARRGGRLLSGRLRSWQLSPQHRGKHGAHEGSSCRCFFSLYMTGSSWSPGHLRLCLLCDTAPRRGRHGRRLCITTCLLRRLPRLSLLLLLLAGELLLALMSDTGVRKEQPLEALVAVSCTAWMS
jgi:hypothetical protein